MKTGNIAYIRFLPRKMICSLAHRKNSSVRKIIGNLLQVFNIVPPFIIIVYCYFKVFKKIREHKRNIAPTNQSSLGTSVQEIKITWTLFAVIFGYFLLWIPVLVVSLVSSYDKRLPRQVHMIVTYSMASNSTINPIIYGVMNPAFRQEYKKIIKCQ
jgi:ABC-type Fe3+ transport system permease subunit